MSCLYIFLKNIKTMLAVVDSKQHLLNIKRYYVALRALNRMEGHFFTLFVINTERKMLGFLPVSLFSNLSLNFILLII